MIDENIILGAGGANVSSLKIQQQSPTKGKFQERPSKLGLIVYCLIFCFMITLYRDLTTNKLISRRSGDKFIWFSNSPGTL